MRYFYSRPGFHQSCVMWNILIQGAVLGASIHSTIYRVCFKSSWLWSVVPKQEGLRKCRRADWHFPQSAVVVWVHRPSETSTLSRSSAQLRTGKFSLRSVAINWYPSDNMQPPKRYIKKIIMHTACFPKIEWLPMLRYSHVDCLLFNVMSCSCWLLFSL